MGHVWELRSVVVGYGACTVLHDLSAELPSGAVTTVLGPGGSGKSTLLRALEGTTPELWCSGELPRTRSWRFPQPCRVRGRALERALVTSARDQLEVWLAAHEGALSAALWDALVDSECALVRASRIVTAQAELLLLDEPDVHLDAQASSALAQLLRVRAGEGATVVLVTHDLSLVHRIADHVVLLVDGVKLDEGALPRIRTNPASERVRNFFTWGT